MSAALRQRGIEVFEAWSLSSARLLISSVRPSVLLLDLSLEDEDGYDLLSEAAADGLPTIVVSAREMPSERVKSLTMGAADYVVKPVDYDELSLRIQRAEKLRPTVHANTISTTSIDGLTLDLVNRTVVYNGKESDVLSPNEFSLVLHLLDAGGRILSREEVATNVLGRASLAEGRSVDVLVFKVRRKMEGVCAGDLIETVRGSGYRLSNAGRAAAIADERG